MTQVALPLKSLVKDLEKGVRTSQKPKSKNSVEKKALKEVKKDLKKKYSKQERIAYNVEKKTKRMGVPKLGAALKNIYNPTALAMALPREYPPVQFRDEFAREKTNAALNSTQTKVSGWNSVVPPSTSIQDRTDVLSFARRIPEACTIQYIANAAAATYEYQWNIIGQSVGQAAFPGISANYRMQPIDQVPIGLTVANNTSAFAPHGPLLFAGAMKKPLAGYVGRYMPSVPGETISVAVTNNTGATVPVSFGLSFYSPTIGPLKGVQQTPYVPILTGTTSTLTLTVAAPSGGTAAQAVGYYSPYLCTNSSTTSSFMLGVSQVLQTGNGEVFAHLPMFDYFSQVAAWTAERMNAVAIQYMNTAADEFRNGTLVGGQIGKELGWTDYLGQGQLGYNLLANEDKENIFPARTGIYGFLLPTGDADFALQQNISVENGQVTDSSWPIDDPGEYLAVIGSINPAMAGGAPTQDGNWITDYGFEYTSFLQSLKGKNPGNSRKSFDAALDQLGKIRQFYENPLHLKDILNGLKNTARTVSQGVLDYGPLAMKFAKMFASAA